MRGGLFGGQPSGTRRMRPELIALMSARALIADPAKWGKGQRGRDRGWETCCAADAIEKSADPENEIATLDAFYRANGLGRKCGDILEWNDDPDTTHADVLAAFDKAIAEAS